MRLDNDRQDIFISDEKTVDQIRYSMIVEEYREKIEVFPDDPGDQEGSDDVLPKVLSKLPLIVVLILFAVAAIMFAKARIVPALLICFIGIPIVNICSVFIKGSKKDDIRNAVITSVFCFVIAIPLFFSKTIGTVASILLAAAVLTGLTGIALIASYIGSVVRKRKYKVTVPAICTGYARTVAKSPEAPKGQNIYYLKTSPVFEYSYEGSDYVSIYDPMTDGGDSDIDMGPVTINIDPDRPEDLWRSEGKAVLAKLIAGLSLLFSAVILAVIVFALGFVK